jgi:hypothetical protein
VRIGEKPGDKRVERPVFARKKCVYIRTIMALYDTVSGDASDMWTDCEECMRVIPEPNPMQEKKILELSTFPPCLLPSPSLFNYMKNRRRRGI